jgi:hypothetical protein
MNVHEYLEKIAASPSQIRKALQVVANSKRDIKLPMGDSFLSLRESRALLKRHKLGKDAARDIGIGNLQLDSINRGRGYYSGMPKETTKKIGKSASRESAKKIALAKALKAAPLAGITKVSPTVAAMAKLQKLGKNYIENGATFDGARKGLTNQQRKLGVRPKRNAESRVTRRMNKTPGLFKELTKDQVARISDYRLSR